MTTSLAASSSVSRRNHDSREFRLADVNPITGRPFRTSRFDDLPYLISLVVERLGVTARQWNQWVRAHEVAEHVDCFRAHTVPWSINRPLRKPRVGEGPAGKCPDCWGTCVQVDPDGSVSGIVGASVLCPCARAGQRVSR